MPVPDRVEPEFIETPSSASPLKILQIAWRRKSLLALGLVVGTVVGGLSYTQKVPLFQTSAQMMVTKKPGNPLQSGSDMSLYYYYEDYLASHSVLIRSPRIVRDAVEQGQLRRLPSLAQLDDPTGAVIGSLTVGRDSASGAPSNILNLSYRTTVPEDCPVVLDAVMESYRRYLSKHFTTVSDDMVDKISQAAATYKQVHTEIEKAYTEFKKKSPLIYWKGAEATSDREDWLTRVQSMRLNLLIRRAEVQGRLESIETALKEGKGRQALLAQLTASTNKAGNTERRWEQDMLEMLLREQQLLSDYGPDHPDVVSLRRRMALTREFFTRESPPETSANVGAQDPVEWHVRSLRQELQDTELSLKALTQMVEEEQKTMRELQWYKDQDQYYREERERAKNTVVEIGKKLSEIQVGQQLGGFNAQVISPPGMGAKINPGVYQYLLAGGLLGLLAGMGLAYLADVTDKSFRTPEEIRRRLGLPVVGHVPLLAELETAQPATADALDAKLVSYHQPKSVQAEAYRGVRTALYFSSHGEVHKVIQVTSPDAGDGKSTLTANLAVSMAQSGKKVILIDADFRKPRQHKIFGLSANVGLASVIIEEAELKDAIQATRIENLDLLPCGPRPPNPAELLTSPRFKELLDAIADEYAWVLVDTPPLLAVSDPSVVAPRVDGVLLVIRVSKNGRPSAERAREVLSTLGANVIGVVVNGAGGDAGAGGYAYHYGNNYEYTDYTSYYDEEEPKAGPRDGQPARKRVRRPMTATAADTGWLGKLRSIWS